MPALTTAFAQGVAASRPAASSSNLGFMFFATDTQILYQSTGSVWTQIAASASGSGTVTSVDVAAPSPLSSSGGAITTSGTITLAWAAGQTQNRVLASPNGSSGAVSLRALVAADIPSLPASQITSGQLALARGGTATDGSSVAGNEVFAAPDGSTGSAGFRALVAADIPALAASKITSGQVAAARGGTGTDSSSTTANTVFAGPASGSAAAPTFRAMAVADVAQPVASGALLYVASTCI